MILIETIEPFQSSDDNEDGDGNDNDGGDGDGNDDENGNGNGNDTLSSEKVGTILGI